MVLALNDLYERYSVRKLARKIEIKRLLPNGTYESDWQDVVALSGLKLLEDSIPGINYALSDSSYNFGIVTVGNVTIKLNSKNGQFDNEDNSGSIFKNYIRHKSQVRIRDGYVDYYSSDSNGGIDVLTTVFQGFIDETSTSTKVDDNNLLQNLQCIDTLSFLLKNYTIADVSPLTSTSLKNLIFEILNRPIFTNFFTVDITKIIPGVDILNLDISQYEAQTQLYTLFENLSVGHSYYYVRDNIFVYKKIDTAGSSSTAITFGNKKTIKFSAYSSGIEKIIEKIYWENDPSSVYISPTNKYNRTKTIEIKGVTDFAQRQLVLNAIGNITRFAKKEFTIEVPYCMFVNILDEIVVESPQIIPSDAFIWGISNWGQARWRRSLQADNIPATSSWLIVKINHTSSTTKIVAKQI